MIPPFNFSSLVSSPFLLLAVFLYPFFLDGSKHWTFEDFFSGSSSWFFCPGAGFARGGRPERAPQTRSRRLNEFYFDLFHENR